MRKKVVVLEMNMIDEEEREIFQAGIPYEVNRGKIENEDNLKVSLNEIWVDYKVNHLN